MNWFERYGIPGLYSILLIVVLCLFVFNINISKESTIINGINLKLEIIISILALIVSISLPIGYILSIITLFLYYKLPEEFSILGFTKLHTEAWKEAEKIMNNKSNSIKLKEELIEAKVAISGRWSIKIKTGREVNEGRWLQEWFTKRWNVIAINQALIVSTLLSCLLSIILAILKSLRAKFFINISFYSLVPFILITFILLFVPLLLSTYVLNKQVKYALVKLYIDLI